MRLWRRRAVRSIERISDAGEADERVLDHLAELGCDPSTPREATHYLYLPRRSGADAVAAVLDRDGWQTRVEPCEGTSWLVTATRVARLSTALVRQTRRSLEALASEHGGLYDGWEAKTG
jgi:hypothetical protein